MKAFRLTLAAVLSACLALAVLGGCTANADEPGKMAITTSSDTAKENFIKGRDLQEKLRGNEARPYFEKAVSEDPDFAMAHLSLAFTSPTAKEFFASLQNAVARADKASEGERLFILAAQAGVNADPVKQREYCEQLAAKFPKDERAQNNLGVHFFGQQDWQKAINAYEIAMKINPDFSPPYNQLGYSYRFMGKYDEAEKTFKKYIEIIPNDPNPYDSYAELLMKIGRYEDSIENYKKALAEHKLAKAKENTKKFRMRAEEKNNKFQKMLSHQMLGMIATAEKDYNSAISELRQANQQNSYNIYRLAAAYEGKGDRKMAHDFYDQAMNFNALNSLQQAFVFAHSDKKMSMKN